MINFSTEQRIIELGDIKIGGQPGELPTVLFGTAFFGKKYHQPDVAALEEVRGFIRAQEDLSKMTGNPSIVDIYLGDEETMARRLEIVMEALPSKRMFSVDVPESSIRQQVLRHASEIGISNRIILNSFNLAAEQAEMEVLKDHPPGCAILLGYNPRDFSVDGRMEMLESGAGYLEKGLMEFSKEFGIDKILLDAGATPFDHSAAETLRAIPVMKNKWGLPVGCAIHNTVESWLWMKQYRKEHKPEYLTCDVGSNALPVMLGADFCVYGPIRNAPSVYPFVAMVDKFMAEGAEDYFGVSQDENHPRRKLG
ncbi:MAG: tetrahydromethanopterin S-methyltransferase subunit H [Thermoplasmata archaeon]|nr:tetrahydromethanopterin S-methyltransferase subunit H [Thermoplasmata archaeon]